MADSVYRPGKLQFVIDPFEVAGVRPATAAARADALREVADYIQESVLSKIGDGVSPVSGRGSFKRLSKDYALEKSEVSGSAIPNLELYGDMLDALETRALIRDGQVALTIEGEEAEKADGHCQLTGRDSNLPVRRFIPGPSETFKSDILAGIRKIVRSYESESIRGAVVVSVSDFVNTEASDGEDDE